MSTRLNACDPTQHVLVETPWTHKGEPIRVIVARPLKRRFLRACKRAKRRSERRQFLGNLSRKAVARLGNETPKFFTKRKGWRGWTPRRIDSYNCRPIAGTDTMSRHAYAAAWDFFRTAPGVPPPGGVWTPDDAVPSWFASEFKKLGFAWGGDWKRKDTPHIEWTSNTV